MTAKRRPKDAPRTYRNEIDRLVADSGLTNKQVASLCDVTPNRVLALRRSNTFEPELVQFIRKALGFPSNSSQECSMLQSLTVNELVDEIVTNVMARLSRSLTSLKEPENDATRCT